MSGHGTQIAVARTGGNPFLKAVAALSTLAGWTSAAMIVAAVAITCQMIFVRFVLNGSTVWQTEAVIYLVIAATLIGLPYVQRLRGHVNVDLVPLALAPRARFVMCMVTLSLSILTIAMMLWYGFEYWHFAYERNWKSDTVWGVRLWIPYLSIPVGFGLLLLQLIADLVAVVLRIETPFGLETGEAVVAAGAEGERF
ncbi:C4-dicarboxylate ABC transporter substrate-binding protein [Brevirhabdus pacifica]|uniref:TRAP transporter small permease protein n=1 Tax=Brevirhabdus pacifica TaxID=1267768 RepID=A0A1U7DFQ9_9RHOB|nr:TRAP transporter small permease [Brevirhabdus pacifica]APX88834.1 C4-dicarboxylate ABC transporter substrate-binding protein [Brevirhabdus pacifica]PJJ86630.1 TRAP-type C4-dicarboxylate transport system permease small subunit [Brevirhabdus pacifica]